MKTRQLLLSIGLIASTALIYTGCKKDDDKTVTPDPVVSTTAELEVHYHAKAGTAPFTLGQDYTKEIGGETITYSFDNVAFYVSGISLKKMAGGTEDLADSYLLVKPGTEHYHVGEIEAVHYTGLTFNVGVDAEANHLDPASYAADHPLAPKNPTMHWDWNPGYRFLVMEGKYSSTDGMSGTFVFHIGLDEFLKSVDMDFDEHLMVEADKEATIHMEVDYLKFIDGIDLRTENYTKSMSASDKPLAQKIVNNIPSAFSVE